METYLGFGGSGRRKKQRLDLRKEIAQGDVMAEQRALYFRHALFHVGSGQQLLAHSHKGAHNIDAHGDSAWTFENGRRHDRAVLGESPGELAPAAVRT